MCTAATYKTKDFYFGRTLDYEFSYGDEVTITPRNYPFHFRHIGTMTKHYAMIGMAYVADDFPLYYEAVNEAGLGMAGLNFVGNADYKGRESDKDNVAQFEFIPWILGQCASVKEARVLLEKINLINTPFSQELPLAQLHWIIADRNEALTVESLSLIHIYGEKTQYFVTPRVTFGDTEANYGTVLNNGYVVRWDLYKEIGCPEINSDEDYIKALKAMKEIYPETEDGLPVYAMSAYNDSQLHTYFYKGCLAEGYVNLEGGIYVQDVETNELLPDIYDMHNPYILTPFWSGIKFYNQL